MQTKTIPVGENWPRVYALLVVLVVTATGSAVYQVERCTRISESIAGAHDRDLRLARATGELLLRGRQLDVPANDVFASKDVAFEERRFAAAAADFDRHLDFLSGLPFGPGTVQSVAPGILDRIRSDAAGIRAWTSDVFADVRHGRTARATAAMAQVDRHYGDLVAATEDLREKRFEMRSENARLYESSIDAVRRFEFEFALFVVLTATGFAVYGRRRQRLDREERLVELSNRQVSDAMSSSLIMAVIDERGRIVEANDNLCRVSGYARGELIGLDHRVFSADGHSPEFFDDLWSIVSSGRTWSGEVANRRKDGHVYHLRAVITPILDVDGKIDRYLKVCYDLTERKRLDDAFLEAQSIAKIGSWRFDLATNRQTWSSEVFRIFEIPQDHPESELNAVYRDRIHPEDRPNFERLIGRALETGEDYVVTFRICLDGGQRIKYVRSIGSATRDQDGRVIGRSGTCQDLTEFILLQEQNKFILESMGIGIWKFNPATQELFWDESLYGVYELDPRDFTGHYQAWRSTLTAEAGERAVQELQSALRGDTDFDTTFEIMTKSGQRKHIGGRTVVIRNDDGQPTMMYGINWDRTKEVMLEASLSHERAKSLHSAKLASLGEMSAGIAHEINNPLAVIVGSVALLDKFRDDDAKFRSKLEIITRSAGRIDKIVKGLKKFSRSSEGTVRSVQKFGDILNDTLIITEAKSKRHATPVTVDVVDDLSIDCDAVEIEQVMVNLINNAIDAVKVTDDRWVKVTAFGDGAAVVVRVTDSGTGIPEDIEKKLTQPFFTTKVVGEGTGLGLSITKGILDSHRASFTLNRDFANTCFELRFARVSEPNGKNRDAA